MNQTKLIKIQNRIMFSTKEHLLKKTGPDGVGRYEFLKELITEYTTTRSLEAKKQTLANLANFAYDPINYEYFKQLHVVDLFLAQLSESDEDLLHFGLAGICNISPDPEFRDYIISLNGICLISNLLNHQKEEIVLDAITSLYFLTEELNWKELINQTIINEIKQYQEHDDSRLRNISNVCLKKWLAI
ncbi:armadillo repeat-containing protein 7 [Coccinella septempunctata]|uniref:armadillo repeat-containing protein 7 n=1 Tax=Coccinella septempunctata TaxID=41139 RepID=UPI001D07A005|nr:armadillo repeat-containing protein 7 [Coccinella septempunctata]